MQKQRNTKTDTKSEVAITLDLPDDFICVCELMNITPKQAVATYIDHVKFYNYIINEDHGLSFKATAIFKKYNDQQFKSEGIQVAKFHKLHINPIKEILRLGASGIGSNSVEYTGVIDRWHKSIFKK